MSLVILVWLSILHFKALYKLFLWGNDKMKQL
jgi:hypothetical protein